MTSHVQRLMVSGNLVAQDVGNSMAYFQVDAQRPATVEVEVLESAPEFLHLETADLTLALDANVLVVTCQVAALNQVTVEVAETESAECGEVKDLTNAAVARGKASSCLEVAPGLAVLAAKTTTSARK